MVRYENVLQEVSQGSYLLIDTAVCGIWTLCSWNLGGGWEMIYEWAEIWRPSMTSFTFLLPVQPCQYTLIYNSLERARGRERDTHISTHLIFKHCALWILWWLLFKSALNECALSVSGEEEWWEDSEWKERRLQNRRGWDRGGEEGWGGEERVGEDDKRVVERGEERRGTLRRVRERRGGLGGKKEGRE